MGQFLAPLRGTNQSIQILSTLTKARVRGRSVRDLGATCSRRRPLWRRPFTDKQWKKAVSNHCHLGEEGEKDPKLYKELLGLPIAVSGCCDVTIPTFDCVTDLSQTATFNSGPLPIPGVLAY